MALLPPSTEKRGPPKGVSGNPSGKAKGTKDHTTRRRERSMLDGGPDVTPLGFMLAVLQDTEGKVSRADKLWAAQQAAPYTHKKMPIAIEGTDKPIPVINATDLATMPTDALDAMLVGLAAIGLTADDDPDAAGS